MNALSGMDLLIAKTAALFALAFFVPALLAFALTPARRKRRRAIAAPMLLDDEPQNETPQTPPGDFCTRDTCRRAAAAPDFVRSRSDCPAMDLSSDCRHMPAPP